MWEMVTTIEKLEPFGGGGVREGLRRGLHAEGGGNKRERGRHRSRWWRVKDGVMRG